MATVFEISGPIALYRKPYTTTSTVSFPIPPPTAVAGLLASIIGIKNGSDEGGATSQFWSDMRGTKTAIQRLNEGAWFSTTINFWNTKEPQKNIHIRVKHQFVKKPHYRIFVEGGLEEKLRAMLETNRFHYIPTLGTAYALADVKYLGFFNFNSAKVLSDSGEVKVASAIPFSEESSTVEIDFLQSKGLLKDVFPFKLDEKRTLLETINLVYPNSPRHRIVLKKWEGLDITKYEEDYIAWLPAW